MTLNKSRDGNVLKNIAHIAVLAMLFSGCGSDSEGENNAGTIKFYNTSSNSPEIYLTVDENLETSDVDEVEISINPVAYGQASTSTELPADSYYAELGWQDGDSSARDELTLVYQEPFTLPKDSLHLITLSGDIKAPTITSYDIPYIDDSDDDLYDRFNLTVLNTTEQGQLVDVYISDDDKTFNEATLLYSSQAMGISENIKLDQGNYVVYLTHGGQSTAIFQSATISFLYPSQYILAIRDNHGAGSSPFIVDRLSASSLTSYADVDAEARFSVINAISTHELLNEYQGDIDVNFNDAQSTPIAEQLSYGQRSLVSTINSGDYSIDVSVSNSEQSLLKNHLISLPENTTKTMVLYADEVAVDHDNDGDVDENGDGIVDQYEVNLHSLVLENSEQQSIYSHQVNLVNLVDSDDFSVVNVYFVRSDETIDSAELNKTLTYASHDALVLNNNTYHVFVVAKSNSSDIILTNFELVLNEESSNLLMLFEADPTAATGYKASVFEQPYQVEE